MEEENKNLKIPEKKGKNWLLRIGVILFLTCIISFILMLILTEGFAVYIIWPFGLPILIFSIILIFIGLLLRIKKRIKWLWIVLLTIFILWLSVQVFYSDPQSYDNPYPVGKFFQKLAVSTNNEFACNFIPMIDDHYKNYCYAEIALQRKDLSICEKINRAYTYIQCYKNIAGDIGDDSICEKCEEERDYCYRLVAVYKSDETICEKIISSEPKRYEKNECYYQIALKKDDPSLCEKIVGEPELSILPERSKDYCYSEFAHKKQDISICEKIQNQDIQDDCYSHFVNEEQDILICEKVQSQDKKDICYLHIARFKEDLSICDKIQSQYFRVQCYISVAPEKQDPSICDMIQNQWNDKDYCYMNIAVAKQDSSICDKIEYETIKNMCHEKLE